MSKPLKKFNIKAKDMADKLDFCGLWRQAEHEDHEFLMNVVEWRLGNSMNVAREDKLWVRAEVTKHEEGRIFPKSFIMVLPKKGILLRADTVYAIGKNTDYPFMIELSGDVFGPSPLWRPIADLTVVWDLEKAERMQKAINLGIVRPGEARDMLGMANGVVKEDEKGV